MKKSLVIDARTIGKTGHGISKYTEGLIHSLGEANSFTQFILKTLQISSIQDLVLTCIIHRDCPLDSPARRFQTIEENTSCYHPLSWLRIPRLLRHLKADLFFNPTFASYPYLGVDYVQTVHDLNHLHYGNFFQKIYYKLLLKKSIKGAKKLLTVSNFVKSELENWVKLPPNQIQVIYNLIPPPIHLSTNDCKSELEKFGLQFRQFFLCISNSKPHKNIVFLARCYQAYRKQTQSAPLPLAVSVRLEDIPLPYREGIISLTQLSDNAITALYQSTAGFFFPSLYEGFGRPPIEAALAGARVCASDIPPHREGGEHCGVNIEFLPPQDEPSWTTAFLSASELRTN